MSKAVITGGKSLAGFLDAVFEEGIKATLHRKGLQEKERQASTVTQDNSSDDEGGTSLFGDDEAPSDKPDDSGADRPKVSKTGSDEEDKLKQGDIESKDVIEKLNSIRSGRSFNDSAVGPAMEEYVGSLSTAERTALFAFLKGIAQIVTGEIPAQQAIEPDSNPSDVHMKKGPDVHKKTIQPNIIKTAAHKRPSNDKSSEDTSGPVPITPKRK